MQGKILYNQVEIYRAIIALFEVPTVRRVAISAFVGKGAQSYLPNPQGITLVCWPKAGGTNPHALRALMARKVDVWFSDRLHMKVYWAEGRGCVLTSANLSTNALGAGNLKEVGILIGSDEIDIDRLLSSLEIRRVSHREMITLDRAHAIIELGNSRRETSAIPSFAQWVHSPSRQAWKLGWWERDDGKASQAAKRRAKEETGLAKIYDFIGARRDDFKQGDWFLSFRLGKAIPSSIRWMFARHVVPVSPKDKGAYEKEFPYQAFQTGPIRHYAGCPFVADRAFHRAFRAAVRDYGAERIRKAKNLEAPTELIDLISKYI